MASGDLASILQTVDALPLSQQHELYQHLAQKIAAQPADEVVFKQRLLDAGLLREVKLPVTDLRPYQNRKLIEVIGKPLSETVIEERR